ncbi:MAG: hypothetical protein ACTSSG_12190 [Candidatus Heimdallarchaeaceae archaeon]
MKPPVCAICYKEFVDEYAENKGGIVYFKKRKSDQKWEDEMRKEGMVGHPPNAEWFCSAHYEQAKALKDLTIDKAMEELRKIFPQK